MIHHRYDGFTIEWDYYNRNHSLLSGGDLAMSLKSALSLILVLVPFTLGAAQEPKFGPDSMRQDGVPQGKVTQMPAWKSTIFPGTVRGWWIYVPAQYDEKKRACVMIFQDGGWYQDPNN